MKFEKVNFSIQSGLDFPLPKMLKVKQHFEDEHIDDISEVTLKTLQSLNLPELAGKRIAITAGSRGIANFPLILKIIVDFLNQKGAEPFIIPAMGSHGGATAEGQQKMLHNLGISEDTIGAPIVSNMEVEQLGQLPNGYPVYFSKTAIEADGVIVCNRIKPHTSIRGIVESGLCKMLVVGLGKHLGATAFHRQGYHKLAEILPQGAKVLLEKANVLFGLGIVENAFDETVCIEAIPTTELIKRESELLNLARKSMPQFFLDEIDVLIVERIGKDISGAGMDPNITGRAITPLPMSAPVPINCIVVLNLTEASHGNATGIGGADIITRQLVEKINFGDTYTNVLTSGALIAARLPIVLGNDWEAVRAAIRCAPREHLRDVKIVRILDTLHLSDIQVSENYLPLVQQDPHIELNGESSLSFDMDGRLL